MSSYLIDGGVTPAINGVSAAVANSSNAIVLAINANTAAIATLTGVLEKSFGEAGLPIPGSPRNSFANTAKMLSTLSNEMLEALAKQSAIAGTIGELSNSVKSQTSTMNNMLTVQTAALADQIVNNAIQQAESEASLVRSGITPQPKPDVIELIKKTVENSSAMRLTTAFQNEVNDITNNLLTKLKDYIVSSALVTWGQAQLTSLWTALGLNKLTEKAVSPQKAALDTQRNLANTNASAGLFFPGGVGPYV